MVRKPGTILIVDDNQADIEMLREAVDEVCPQLVLLAACSGEDCLRILRQAGEANGPVARPDLILLDLNMPGTDGRAVLRELKGDPRLSCLPVIILTTSGAEKDVVESYRQYANSYLVKPLGYDELKEMVRAVLHYWLEVARIPSPALP